MGKGASAAGPTSLVVGASGYTGRALVDELCSGRWSSGARVLAHLRPERPGTMALAHSFREKGAQPVILPLEQAAILELLERERPSHVFLVHGTTRRRARAEGIEGDPYQAIDLGVTRLVLSALQGAGLAPRLLYLSAQGAGSLLRSPYLVARAEAEEAVRRSGLPFTIARAPIISGRDRPEPRPAERVGGLALGLLAGTLRRVGAVSCAAHIAPTTARELAYGLAHAAFNYTTLSRTLEAEELRYEGPLDRMGDLPATRRDDPRFQ